MPMYWDAYLADTTHLTTEEHGAYMLLLAAMWRRNGAVPDDDKDNARILGLTPAKWRKVKARFMATISGFAIENGTITQEKLQKTWKNTQEKIDKNRVNGAKGGRGLSNKVNDLDEANASKSLNPNASIPEPEPDITLPIGSDGRAVDLADAPYDLGKDLFDRGVAYLGRNGVAETNARSLVGKWRKANDDADVFSAFREASDKGVSEPVAWITARLTPKVSQSIEFNLSDFDEEARQ